MRTVIALTLLVCLGCSDAPQKNNAPNNSSSNETNNTTNNATSNATNNETSNSTNNVPLNNPTADPTVIDLLFVVDNSGSMCQEQAVLRDNFRFFLEQLNDANLDFQIGITTTQMNDDYALEPVASPARLQSTPQPVPGFDRSCHTSTGEDGMPIIGDYEPIRQAISAAVECMDFPDPRFITVTDSEIECAMYGTPSRCSIESAGCGGDVVCTPEHLFPDPSEYRPFPRVFRSADYTNGATFDIEAMAADFGCAAFVGTRGYGIEKGLAAAVEAVSPELTGGALGAVGADATAPNHGLLREDARFGLVFLTDENDCSHGGTIPEDSACGGDVCEFSNVEGADDLLLDPAVMASDLIDNLRQSKGAEEFGVADVFVASIHGNYKRYSGPGATDEECGMADYEGVAPSCATALGVAYSGDRYDRFLRAFPAERHFPQANPANPDAELTGWMCTGDFSPALSAIAQLFGTP